MNTPIFFLWTRSFLAFVAALVLTLVEAPEMWAPLLELTGFDLAPYAPLVLFAFAVWQRSGAARPYSINPADR